MCAMFCYRKTWICTAVYPQLAATVIWSVLCGCLFTISGWQVNKMFQKGYVITCTQHQYVWLVKAWCEDGGIFRLWIDLDYLQIVFRAHFMYLLKNLLLKMHFFRYVPSFNSVNQVLHILFVFLPLIWSSGILPPIDVVFQWAFEQLLVFALGGSPVSSDLRCGLNVSYSLYSHGTHQVLFVVVSVHSHCY